MRYKLLLVDEVGCEAELLLATDDEAILSRVRGAMPGLMVPGGASPGAPALAPTRPGPKGRAVVVTAAEEDNGMSYQTGDTFPNAMAASTVLGFSYNAVSVLLAQAARRGERGISVKGLTLCYVDALRD